LAEISIFQPSAFLDSQRNLIPMCLDKEATRKIFMLKKHSGSVARLAKFQLQLINGMFHVGDALTHFEKIRTLTPSRKRLDFTTM
jgi:hypothetical protein